MAQNQYKLFRAVDILENQSVLTKRYDEPTYVTFKVMFGDDFASWSGVTLFNTNYDKMPHPLFNPIQTDATKSEGPGGRTVYDFNRETYSTIDYLRDANEFSRGEMMKEFIIMWNDLQRNFQYYFRSVDGVGELLKPAPGRGRRVLSDFRLTFNMAEGIDQRVSYLLNLYRKIAWDDTYQRWVLPDMMRYFSIKIYMTEFRTFHRSSILEQAEGPTQSQQTNIYNYGGAGTFGNQLSEALKLEQIKKDLGFGKRDVGGSEPLYLSVLNGILPTHMIECQMCEFDIENFNFAYKDNLSVYDAPTEATVSFQVKVGNVNEVQTYPLFTHYLFDDYKMNGINRSKEFGLTKNLNGRITGAVLTPFATTRDAGDARYAGLDKVAQNTTGTEQKLIHEAGGVPFNQSVGTSNLKNSSPNAAIEINPTDPATWLGEWGGNALKFGKAFTINFIAEKADKAKMISIPGLGFSFNDAVAAIESKSFVSILGLIRRAIAESVGGAEPTSSQLDKRIDTTFREFLTGLTQSEATDGDELELIKVANLALTDAGTWDIVRDYSIATDLVGPGETNYPVEIEGRNAYKQSVAISTNNDRSIATDLDGNPKFINTGKMFGNQIISDATNTNQKDLEGKKYTGNPVDGLTTIIQASAIIDATPSSATSGRKLDTNKILQGNESGLGTSISDKGPQSQIISEATDGDQVERGNLTGSGGLGDKVDGGNFAGSGGLGDSVQGGNLVGGGELGKSIDGELKTTNILSEATDGDAVENKLPQPNPSKATNNPIE